MLILLKNYAFSYIYKQMGGGGDDKKHEASTV